MLRFRHAVFFSIPLAGLLAAGGFALAQKPAGDPTVPSEALRGVLEGSRGKNAPAALALEVPEIRLLARVRAAGKPAAGMIDVGGQLLTIREGDKLPVSAKGWRLVVEVLEISAAQVRLNIAPMNQEVVLR